MRHNLLKADNLYKELLKTILEEGCLDQDPRPHYEDILASKDNWYISNDKKKVTIHGTPIRTIELSDVQSVKRGNNGDCILCTPAHTLSINHAMCSYDLSKGELPLITLRPIATKTSIAEIIWIYILASNDLVVFDELLGKNTWDENHEINNWWKDWAIKDTDGNYLLNEAGHPHIGCCYGETVRQHNLFKNLIQGLKENPDGRRHIMNMWQEEDFSKQHGLKPCAFQTTWNVRHKNGVDYLDMCLFQRSSDFCTAGSINQFQYTVLLYLVAKECGYIPGKFSWMVANIQIYDRHVEQAEIMLKRESLDVEASIEIADKAIWDMKPEDIKLVGYNTKEIKKVNSQLKFDLGI